MNEAGFLEAIAAEPDDDTHRLVFADWLDDHDDPARAAFLRTQVELARTDEADPRYPELVARTRRTGMLTAPRTRPMVDHVPGGRVYFRRGLIAGVAIDADAYLRQPSEAWAGVPVEQLLLEQPRSAAWVGELPKRAELARLRTLCFDEDGDWTPTEIDPLLTGASPFAGLRALRLPVVEEGRRPWLEGLVQRLALPALDSLAINVQEMVEDWSGVLPRSGPPLRRVVLSGQPRAEGNWDWVGPPLDWLLRSRHGATLEDARLRMEVDRPRDSILDVAAAPLNDPALLRASRLRYLEVDGASLPRLTAEADWGPVQGMALRGGMAEEVLDDLLATPQARRLRSLIVDAGYDPNFEEFDLPLVRDGDPPAWRRLGLIDWAPDLMKACARGLHRFRINDLADDLTFAQEKIEFPELRELWLDTDQLPRRLGKLLVRLKAPNLCTLILTGVVSPRVATARAVARLPGLPHLSLFGAGDSGVELVVLADGEAHPVAAGVIPIEQDWWDPMADRPR